MSGFFGLVMSSLQPKISSTLVQAPANATTSSINVSSTANNRGTLTYSWQRTGTTCTINTSNAVATTFTGSGTAAGSTIVYCNITDSVTGVTTSSPECVITWTVVVNQNVAISGTVTYTGSAQAYTLTGTPATPAPTGTPSTFINAGTYVYPTNITSITSGSGYTLGTVTGSFVINRATISGTAANPSLTYNGALQTATVITNVLPAGATYSGSVTASGTNAGTYTSSITGSGNYQGTVNGGTFTINRASITAMSFTLNGVAFTTAQSRTAGTSYTIAVSSTTPSGATSSPTTLTVSTTGSYSLTSAGTGNYQGSFTSPVLTLTGAAPTGSITILSATTSSQQPLQANLSGAVATSYSWARVSGTIPSSFTSPTQQIATLNATGSGNVTVQCTISYSGGTVTPQTTITFPRPI